MNEENEKAEPADAPGTTAPFSPARLRMRIDGWTPEKQRLFCETLADCGLVREAAKMVDMTPQSAYRLRRRAEGRSFALAWDAALYLARQRLIDEAIERAMEGNVDTYSKDGQVVGERRRKDSRFLLATITKLEESLFCNRATRAIAQEFDEFLDCMEGDANCDLAIDGGAGPAEGAGSCAGEAAAQFLAARANDQPGGRREVGKSHERLVRLGRYATGMQAGLSSTPASRGPEEFEPPSMEFTVRDIENWDEWEKEFRLATRTQP